MEKEVDSEVVFASLTSMFHSCCGFSYFVGRFVLKPKASADIRSFLKLNLCVDVLRLLHWTDFTAKRGRFECDRPFEQNKSD